MRHEPEKESVLTYRIVAARSTVGDG
jgi:hypothetical protein